MENDSKEYKLIKDYPYFLCITLGYALFYIILLYKNPSGITFPVFTLGTVFYFILCMKKLEISFKKQNIFYMVFIELFGLSVCLTDNEVINFLNKVIIFLLIIMFLIDNFYDNKNWKFTGYLKAILCSLFFPVGFIHKPFNHFYLYKKQKENQKIENKKIKYIFLGILISIPILCVVVTLLISSDMVFKSVFESIFQNFTIDSFFVDGFFISVLFVVFFLCTYMLISFFNIYEISEDEKKRRNGEPILAITVSFLLTIIYVIFCIIQVVYLFLGSKTGLTLPYGMTYSEYAREGFFQLLFVSIINWILVLIGIYIFQESKILKTLLAIITSCTFIMIVSSMLRMILYIKYQYLTFLRVFVLWALVVIFIMMVGVMIAIFKEDFPLFKYGMIAIILCYMFLSFGRTDYIIAKVNVDNMSEETQYEFFKEADVYDDLGYLVYDLSIDAAPVVNAYLSQNNTEEYFSNLYKRKISEKTQDLGIRNFNLSKFIAKLSNM